MDLGFERAGMKTIWMCERDRSCVKLLNEKWKGVPIYNDVNDLLKPETIVPKVDVLIGGDPCPSHSIAKGGKQSAHPDLSGHFLAVAGRLAPRWVVRENVPSPDVDHFATALESIGYHVRIVWINAAALTSQNREREFVVGCTDSKTLEEALCITECYTKSYSEIRSGQDATSCILASSSDSCIRETHIWEPSRGIRGFTVEERESLAGFPTGWTSGFSDAIRKRMLGNAVVPEVAKKIAVRIVSASANIKSWPKLDSAAGILRILGRKLPLWSDL